MGDEVKVRACTWGGDFWNMGFIRGKITYNRPLNTEPVSLRLAQKIAQALFNNFHGLEVTVKFGGVSIHDQDEYWVLIPGGPTPKKEKLKIELMPFVRGYIVCDSSC